MSKKNILILGRNGQIGFCLSKKDWGPGFSVLSLGRQEADVTDYEKMEEILGGIPWDFIINAVAYRNVEGAERERELCHAVNVEALSYLALWCHKHGVPLFHYSTDYVFDGRQDKPYEEEQPTRPLNYYGETKQQGEEIIKKILPHHLILRVSWVYGAYGQNFTKKIWKACGTSGNLYFPEDQVGCPTWAEDISDATVCMIKAVLSGEKRDAWGLYHYSGAPQTSWYEVASYIVEFYNKTQSPLVKRQVVSLSSKEAQAQFNFLAQRPSYSYLSCRKIESVFGLKPLDWRARMGDVLRLFAEDCS